jgi:prepilin-type N-terminal cleavage/methylation domain-containing protein/prepilin-type processing-associated H-X9-DG protein
MIGSVSKKGFTLIELLVVILVVALLLGILGPALAVAKQQAIALVCKSNLRQLVLANIGYATENDDTFVLAAEDIATTNLCRWHGVRNSTDDPFNSSRSPLADYFGNGEIKKCSEKVDFRHGDPWNWDFEDGCGGYGYNMTYIGSRMWESGFTAAGKPTKSTEVSRPQETLMFTDTAMTKLDGLPYYLEYSFVEPRHFVINGQADETDSIWGTPSPSIHFRHRGKANVGWVGGHVTGRPMGNFGASNAYEVSSIDMMINWFAPMDNRLFDLE